MEWDFVPLKLAFWRMLCSDEDSARVSYLESVTTTGFCKNIKRVINV